MQVVEHVTVSHGLVQSIGVNHVPVFLDRDEPEDQVSVHGPFQTLSLPYQLRVTSITSSATPTPNADTTDMFLVTALAAGATFAAPTGVPIQGQKLTIRIKDNATAQTLAFNAIYRAGTIALPTTTILSKTMYLGFIYNFTDTKWDFCAYLDNL